jgi:hypothetical protein
MLNLAFLVLASTLVANDPSVAYTGTNPVHITACSIEPLFTMINAGDTMMVQPSGAMLQIGFVNGAPKTIASVTFAVKNGGKMTNIVDAGTFSSGVEISHDFGWSYFSDNVDCAVASVRYADGSTWAPSPQTAARI